ncbi:hypothetical protein D3C72_2208450 [compost metagenome]
MSVSISWYSGVNSSMALCRSRKFSLPWGMSSSRNAGGWIIEKSTCSALHSASPLSRNAVFSRITKLNKFRSCFRNISSFSASMSAGSSGDVPTGAGELRPMKASTCEPR